MIRRLLVATRSAGKWRELDPLLAAAGFAPEDLVRAGLEETEDEVELEAFETFEANAVAKARHFFSRSGGVPTVADDSGLEVQALGGRPGVRSKRWSGLVGLDGRALDDANNAKLLSSLLALAGVSGGATNRAARYVCAAAYVDGDREVVARGETAGTIALAARGSRGFGYDPYFVSDELRVTFGEASRELKERVSHRARAFRALIASLG